MTQCNQESFEFQAHLSREVVARFDGGTMTSDAGAVLLREDPLLAVLSGKPRPGEETLAGKSTLNRLELGGEQPTRYKKIHYREAAIRRILFQRVVDAVLVVAAHVISDQPAKM